MTLKTEEEEWYEQSQFKLTLSSRCSFLKSKVFKRTQTQRLWAVSAFGNSKPVLQVTCARVRGHWRLQTFCITGSPTSSGPQRGWLQVVMSRGVKLRSLNILTNKLMWPLTLTPPPPVFLSTKAVGWSGHVRWDVLSGLQLHKHVVFMV